MAPFKDDADARNNKPFWSIGGKIILDPNDLHCRIAYKTADGPVLCSKKDEYSSIQALKEHLTRVNPPSCQSPHYKRGERFEFADKTTLANASCLPVEEFFLPGPPPPPSRRDSSAAPPNLPAATGGASDGSTSSDQPQDSVWNSSVLDPALRSSAGYADGEAAAALLSMADSALALPTSWRRPSIGQMLHYYRDAQGRLFLEIEKGHFIPAEQLDDLPSA